MCWRSIPPQGAASPGAAGTSSRKVSLGTVPDFAFPGPGVRLDGVVPGSPAEKAGLAKGDVIVALGDRDVADLRAFSQALAARAAGQRVKIDFVREGEKRSVEAVLVER